MNSKKLHLHALPVIILSTGLIYISIFALSHLIVANKNSPNSLSALISAHLYDIKPASNGFFRVSSSFPTENAQNDAQLTIHNATVVGGTFMTGQDTELQASLTQASSTQIPPQPPHH